MSVDVVCVGRAEDWRDFLSLPDLLHHGDPHYTPLSPEVLRLRLTAADPATQCLWLARRDGRPAARLAARLVPGMTGVEGRAGVIGFFESRCDEEAVRLLLDAGRDWLRGKGAHRAYGPMDGDTWHRYRFNLGPYDTRPFMLEPVNPPWYPGLWTDCGFREEAQYLSKHVPDVAAALPSFAEAYRNCLDAGFHFRSLDPGRFEEELQLLYRLSCRIFPVNPFYTEIGLDEFMALYRPFKSVMTPSLVWFCSDREGAPAAFLFSTPDYFEALRRMGGGRGWTARLRFLLHRRSDTLNIKSMGVCPEHRGLALGSALIHQAFAAGLRRGLTRANLCLMHVANRSTGYDAGLGQVSRRYALYRSDLADLR